MMENWFTKIPVYWVELGSFVVDNIFDIGTIPLDS